MLSKPMLHSNYWFTFKKEIRPMIALATPIALSLLLNNAMSLVDTLFVGQISPEAISGVSIASAVFSVFLTVGMGLLAGMDYLASYAYGAKDIEKTHHYLVQSQFLSFLLSLAFTFFLLWIGQNFNHFQLDWLVAKHATEYMRVLAWSFWPTLAFVGFRQYLQAMGVAKPMFWILCGANVGNIFLDWMFIFGHLNLPALGVAGTGYATLVSRWVMLMVLVVFTYWRDRQLHLGLNRASWFFSFSSVKEMLRLGLPSGLHMLFEVGVFASATLLAGRLGAIPLAAHHIVLNIASNVFMLPLGLSIASAVCVGQSLGRGSHQKARHMGWSAIVLAGILMFLIGVLIYLLSDFLLSGYTQDNRVLKIAHSLMIVTALFQLFDGLQVVSTGVLRGIGNTKAPMIANLIGHWGIGLPLGYFLCFDQHLGAHGLWIGLALGLILVSLMLVLVWRYQSKRLTLKYAHST